MIGGSVANSGLTYYFPTIESVSFREREPFRVFTWARQCRADLMPTTHIYPMCIGLELMERVPPIGDGFISGLSAGETISHETMRNNG